MPAFVAAAIEVFLSWFSRMVVSRIGQWIISAALFFGIEFVSTHAIARPAIEAIAAHFTGMAGAILDWIRYLQVDKAISIIVSAHVAARAKGFVMRKVTPAGGSA